MPSQVLTAGGPHYYRLRADSDVGGEVYERRLLEHLPAHGVNLILGLPHDHRITDPVRGWTVHRLRHREGLHWVLAPLVWAPYTLRLLRRERVDVLRGYSVRHTGPVLLLARALARSRTPVVLHHHHLEPRWARLEAAIARRADAVVAVSHHARDALAGAGVPAERIHVVLQGIEPGPAAGGEPPAWPGSGLRLLFLGRLEARKGPGVALDALAALRRDGHDASLVVAGDGPLREALAAQAAAAGIADRVAFAGRVFDATKWALYDRADVLLFPSTLEGFGRVVAEAQSRGLPAVAATGTAAGEALDPGRSGLLSEPTGEAFAASVLELADPAQRAEMSRAARDFARRFDWDACAAGVAEIYRETLEHGLASGR